MDTRWHSFIWVCEWHIQASHLWVQKIQGKTQPIKHKWHNNNLGLFLILVYLFQVFNLAYEDGKVPEAVSYLTGEFELDTEQQNSKGLMAPLYFNKEKDLYLFSHHPKGLVWQVSTKLSMTPLRGIHLGIRDSTWASEKPKACPDSNTLTWEWFNSTTSQGQQIYVKDDHIHVKCLDKFWSFSLVFTFLLSA